MAVALTLLVLILIFGFWSVLKGIFWLTVLMVLAFIALGVWGGGLLKKRN